MINKCSCVVEHIDKVSANIIFSTTMYIITSKISQKSEF